MPTIQKLTKHLVNKIAAGEVVERPASVLKELVENAMDAGSSRIEISVEDGGKKLIQVSDDGQGMDENDIRMAFMPHATSKLIKEEDLFNIRTMGFRGEALASIAAISHASIRSRQHDSEGGWEIAASGDKIDSPTPCSAPPGTRVAVRDLFFNTPARRKFMKTANTEFGHITEQLIRLALPRPNMSFVLRHNGRETLNLPPVSSTLERVADIFASDLADSLTLISPRGNDVSVSGLVAPPSAARSTSKWQYVFLNGRYIRDRLISHAIRESYRGLLDGRQSPVVFLFIEIDPQDVDVNVHPTKIEVRFKDSNYVYREVLAAISETLSGREQVSAESVSLSDVNSMEKESRGSTRQALLDFFAGAPSPPVHSSRNRSSFSSPTMIAEPGIQYGAPASFEASPGVFQVHNSYIIAETDEGIEIYDQHALHERILYNELKDKLADNRLESQGLLVPDTVSVTPIEADSLENRRELLDTLGIEVVPFGPGTIAVQRFPSILTSKGVSAAEFVRQLLDLIAEEDVPVSGEQALEQILEMMACKSAIKAGDPLSQAEITQLLESAQNIEKSSSCPHGRPTVIRLTISELEKRFRRT